MQNQEYTLNLTLEELIEIEKALQYRSDALKSVGTPFMQVDRAIGGISRVFKKIHTERKKQVVADIAAGVIK